MSYASARTVIHNHLVAAGTAITRQITNVHRGAPLRMDGRMIRSWYTGDTDSDLIPDTLTDDTLAERVAIGAYWPLAEGAEDVAEAVDDEIQALKAEIKQRLVGDEELGGNVAASTLADFTVEYLQNPTGGWVAALITTLDLHLIDTDTIGD